MRTVIPSKQRSNHEHQPRWDRPRRAALLDQYHALHAQGCSLRQAAQARDVPRSPLQAWRAYQESLDAPPAVVALFHSSPGLAFFHRLVLGRHLVCTAIGACGIRLGCFLWTLTGLDRFVGASYGTQHQGNRQVEDAIVAYRREESARLAQDMPAKAITLAQAATLTGGLCLVATEPVSHSMVLEPAAHARDHDTWQRLMEQALAGRNGQVIQATSDEAPGLLAYVDHHLGAQHSPDLCHVQHARVKAVSGALAIKQRAARKAATEAQAMRAPRQEQLQNPSKAPAKRGPGRPSKATASLEPVAQTAEAASREEQRLAEQRETVARSIRAMGHAYHCVDLERGVRRNGKRMAGDSQAQIDTVRPVAQQAGRSQTGVARIETAERMVPKMQATIAFVSGDVRRQVSQLDLAPPASYAMHAFLLPSFDLERVAHTRTVSGGEPLRALATRLRTSLFEPGGVCAELSPTAQSQLKHQAKTLAEVFQRSSAKVEGRNGYLSLRNHQLRGLEHPRKRACLTAVHNFCRTRADGTTAAERFFGQKPRSMFAAILASVDIPPAPLSPPLRAVG